MKHFTHLPLATFLFFFLTFFNPVSGFSEENSLPKKFKITYKLKKNDIYRYVSSHSFTEKIILTAGGGREVLSDGNGQMEKELGFLVGYNFANGDSLLYQSEVLKRQNPDTKEIESWVAPLTKILLKPNGAQMNLTARVMALDDIEKNNFSPISVDVVEASYQFPLDEVSLGEEFVQEENQTSFQFRRVYKVAGFEEKKDQKCLKIFFKETGRVLLKENLWGEKSVEGVLFFALELGAMIEMIEKGTIWYIDFAKVNGNPVPLEKRNTFNNLTILVERSKKRP